MTKNQYENIVETTIKNEPADKGGLDTVRDILKNLGIGFPKGDVKEIRTALETEDFMGWEKCDGKEAEEALENGTPVIAVTGDKVFIVTGERGGTDLTNGSVSTQEELKKLPAVLMYMYSGNTTDGYPVAPHISGDMYIQNDVSGRYLIVSGGSLVLASSPISPLDDSAKWRFVYSADDDHCFIVPVSNTSKRLCVGDNGSIYLENSGIQNKGIKWNVLVSDTQNYLIRNQKNAGYLSGMAATLYINTSPLLDSEWSICDISCITAVQLPMNCNLNQKYYMNDINIILMGCGVCACCDAASYYHGSAYTLADMATAGVYTPCDPTDITGESGDVTCYFYYAPSARFDEYTVSTEAQARQTIKEEILAGRPVVVRIGAGVHEHYVVAYGFENNAASNSDIKILDPCNLHPSITHLIYGIPASEDAGGQTITLAASMAEQGGYHNNVTYSILSIFKTSPKV